MPRASCKNLAAGHRWRRWRTLGPEVREGQTLAERDIDSSVVSLAALTTSKYWPPAGMQSGRCNVLGHSSAPLDTEKLPLYSM